MNTLSTITQHSLLLVQGPDARKFLQGQVTCDIDQLFTGNTPIKPAFLGAHCTHKGRMVFTFRAIAWDEETIALCIPTNNLENATKALGKYIVFSKAKLIPVEDYCLLGIEGEELANIAKNDFTQWPEAPNTATHDEGSSVICLGQHIYELWLPTEKAAALKEKLNTQLSSTTEYSDDQWNYVKINQGIVDVQLDSSEMWTPHAINLHETGFGVSFKKGCYTGQEVVARMEYLGKLKRKMFIFTLPTNTEVLPAIGAPLYTPGKTQSIGDVVAIASNQQQPQEPPVIAASATVTQVEDDAVYLDEQCQHKLSLLS